MNKYEQVLFEKELKNIIFSYSKTDICTIYPDRKKERLKKGYEEVACSLKLLKDLKEKELQKEKTYTFTKPIYTDEDIEFLKQAVADGELSISDLTLKEAIMVGFTGEEHRRAERKVANKMNLSKKEDEEFNNKISNMNSSTPNIMETLYNQIKKTK